MMNVLASFIASGILSANLTVSLPEGREITVMDDPAQPFVVLHEIQVNTFLSARFQGVLRVIDPEPTDEIAMFHKDTPSAKMPGWNEDGLFNRLFVFDLVGIAASASPQVYEINMRQSGSQLKEPLKSSKVLPAWKSAITKRDGKDISIRSTDWFEDAALEQLRKGHAFVTTQEGTLLRGCGPIRAMQSCMRCHGDAQVGDVLGAFTYFAVQSPVDNKAGRQKIKALLDKNAPTSELDKELSMKGTSNPYIRGLLLACNGFVTPSFMSMVKEGRARIEATLRQSKAASHSSVSLSPKQGNESGK